MFNVKNLKKSIIIFKVERCSGDLYRACIDLNKGRILVLMEYQDDTYIYILLVPTNKQFKLSFESRPVDLSEFIEVDSRLKNNVCIYYADTQLVSNYLDGLSGDGIPYGGNSTWVNLTCNRVFIKKYPDNDIHNFLGLTG